MDHMALLVDDRDRRVPFCTHPSKLTASLTDRNTGEESSGARFLTPSENSLTHDTPHKGIDLFHRTKNQEKMFFTSSSSPHSHIFGQRAAGVNVMNAMFEENWDENHLTDGEGENDLAEDTEEIDALLYSDDDDYDEEEDEEASTGRRRHRHMPFVIADEALEEATERAASSDDSRKRRKMQAICGNLHGYEVDATKREKKVRILRALGILESLVPGLDSRDPLSIIDESIMYLKSMRTEAEAMGSSNQWRDETRE